MSYRLILSLSALLAIGCGGSQQPAPAADPAPAAKPAAGAATTTSAGAAMPAAGEGTIQAEIACGHCVYHMDGVQMCNVAAKVDDKMVVVEGAIDDLDHGALCSGTQTATVTGRMEEGKLIASKIAIQ